MTQVAVKNPVELPAVRRWESTESLMEEVHRTLEGFRQGRYDPESTRLMNQAHRNAIALAMLMFEHARATGRLAKGMKSLPGFKFAEV